MLSPEKKGVNVGECHRFTVFSQFPAYSFESSTKLPQTARKYREQAVYEAVVTVSDLFCRNAK